MRRAPPILLLGRVIRVPQIDSFQLREEKGVAASTLAPSRVKSCRPSEKTGLGRQKRMAGARNSHACSGKPPGTELDHRAVLAAAFSTRAPLRLVAR